jgi:CheY-like chemotaxis protein/CelD/BcsL family acetyltransferase involved in cellulose biosynthesis
MPNATISIIDDDPSVREATIDLLNSAGFVAETFKDADEFLKSGRVDDASCVVADMRMPGMSGLELHDHLLRAGKSIPTILITAFPKDGDRALALGAGVCCYLSKPFSESDLLSNIRNALSSGPRCDEPLPPSRNKSAAVDTDGRSGDWDFSASFYPVRKPYTGSLRIEELNDLDALEKITPEWEILDAQLSPRTPFTSPLWAKLWWRHCRRMQTTIRQESFAHTVRDEAGKLLAIVPLMITHRPGYGPLQLRILQFFGGADGSITEHRSIICREADELQVMQALESYLCDRKNKDAWDLFVWTGIRHKEIALDHPGNVLRVYKDTPDYLVPLPDSWEKLRSGLSANMKEAIRKCYKHLAKGGHTFKFHAVARPEDVAASLDHLLALHAERANFKYAARHRDLFERAPHRAFIVDLAQLMAERDQFRTFELEVDGKTVASRMAFLLGDELYLYYSGYDLAWRKHSIMTTLMCECFKWAIERGVKVVNLSKGKDPSKLRWRGREIMFHDALLMSPTRRGRLISRAYDLLSRQPNLFVKLTEFLTVVGGVVSLIRLDVVAFY